MTPFKKLDEVRNRALRFIRMGEDKKVKKRTNTSNDHPNMKNVSSSQKSYRAKPYSRLENHRVNALKDEDYPKISDYYFSINILGLV